MRFKPTSYKGQEIITTYIDWLANWIFGGVLIERVAFLFMIALFLTIAQLLFDDRRHKYVHRAGLFALVFLNYPLIIYTYWMITLDLPINLISIFYWTYIFDWIAIMFYIVFIWFSIFVYLKRMTRYVWTFFVSTIILVVDMFLYMTYYNESILIFGMFLVLLSSIGMWALLLYSSRKNKSR